MSNVQTALGLFLPGPTSFSAVARKRAGSASDRLVAPVVKRMVGKIVVVHVIPHVLVLPFREGIELPDAARLVPFDLLGVRARGRLLAPYTRDPGLCVL